MVSGLRRFLSGEQKQDHNSLNRKRLKNYGLLGVYKCWIGENVSKIDTYRFSDDNLKNLRMTKSGISKKLTKSLKFYDAKKRYSFSKSSGIPWFFMSNRPYFSSLCLNDL